MKLSHVPLNPNPNLPAWRLRPTYLAPTAVESLVSADGQASGQQGQGETERVCPACRLASC